MCHEVGCVYVFSVVEEECVPVFLHVKKIICARDVWLLCGCMLVPVTFSTAYHAFAVDVCIDWLAVKPRQLSDHTKSKHDLFCLNGQH